MMNRFDWSHYLELADELSKCDSADRLAEARQRCAVSRAYYSVLIRARNTLQRSMTVPTSNTHTFVIDKFLQSPDQNCQDIGDYLGELRKYRTRADYENSLPNLGYFVALVLKIAQDTAELLDNAN